LKSMAGHIKRLIEELIEVRAAGNAGVEYFLRAHLALNGIDPSAYTNRSPDDQDKVRRLQQMIAEFRGAGGSER